MINYIILFFLLFNLTTQSFLYSCERSTGLKPLVLSKINGFFKLEQVSGATFKPFFNYRFSFPFLFKRKKEKRKKKS